LTFPNQWVTVSFVKLGVLRDHDFRQLFAADTISQIGSQVTILALPLVAVLALLNGVAEEIFFRGALFAVVPRRAPVLITTAIYVAATLATGNALLVFAAVLMGTVFAWARQRSGAVLEPMVIHLTWTLIMVLALPPILA